MSNKKALTVVTGPVNNNVGGQNRALFGHNFNQAHHNNFDFEPSEDIAEENHQMIEEGNSSKSADSCEAQIQKNFDHELYQSTGGEGVDQPEQEEGNGLEGDIFTILEDERSMDEETNYSDY